MLKQFKRPWDGAGQKRFAPVVLVLLAMLLSACVSMQKPALKEAGVAPALSAPSEATYHILAAELALQRGQIKMATKEYLAALRLHPGPELAERTVKVALHSGDKKLERDASQRWVTVAPNSLSAWQTVTMIDLAGGYRTTALSDAEQVVKLDPHGPGHGLRQVALIFSQETAHHDDALKIMDKLVQRHSQLAQAYYARGLLSLKYGDFDAARDDAEKALSLQPDFAQASLLKAGVEIKSGHARRAQQTMRRVFQRKPKDVEARVGYARLLLDAGQIQPAAQQLGKVLAVDPGNADALYATALLKLKADKEGRARHYFQRLLRTGEKHNEAAYYLGRIAEDLEEDKKALHWYKQVDGVPQALDAVLRRARLQAKLGHVEKARHFLENLRKHNPQLAPQLYQEEGALLNGAGSYQKAAALYQRALQAFPDNSDLRYGYAITLDDQGQHGQARKELRRIIDSDPDNAEALNALGYLMTNQTDDYDKARGYIQKALKITPDDPAIMDSMGWVEHRLGNNQVALSYLRQAYGKLRNPVVAAHLGTVLWVLGHRSRARKVWDKASGQHPDNTILQSTIHRYTQ